MTVQLCQKKCLGLSRLSSNVDKAGAKLGQN